MFSTPTRRLLFLALTTLASAMWLAKDHLHALVRSGSATRDT